MDAQTIGVIVAPLGTTVVAFFGYLATRNSHTRQMAERAEASIEDLRESLDEQRTRVDVAMTHIYDLHGLLRELSVPIPRLPAELQSRWRRTTARDDRGRPRHHHDDREDSERDRSGADTSEVAAFVRGVRGSVEDDDEDEDDEDDDRWG